MLILAGLLVITAIGVAGAAWCRSLVRQWRLPLPLSGPVAAEWPSGEPPRLASADVTGSLSSDRPRLVRCSTAGVNAPPAARPPIKEMES